MGRRVSKEIDILYELALAAWSNNNLETASEQAC